jgi:hypothetical protein
MKINGLYLMFFGTLGLSGSAAARNLRESAAADLGFSGAQVVITSTWDLRSGTSHRLLTLIGPNGAKRTAQLHDGGGHAGPSSLNLYHLDQENFAIRNSVDCYQIDAIHIRMRRCVPPTCGSTHTAGTYLGRFDWMNGYDRPKGEFRLGFRYLPSYDATEDLSCPAHMR